MTPRTATPIDPSRSRDSSSARFVAQLLGRPLIDWQRYAVDLIGEKLDAQRYAWPVVVIMVPRQVGKTTAVLSAGVGRIATLPDFRGAYTAQTGQVAAERFAEWFGSIEQNAALSGRIKVSRASSAHRMEWRQTRSFLRSFPPKDGALRSAAFDLVVVDEAQEHDELTGRALDQTIVPTFSTRPRRQLIVIGTAGTDRSAYFSRYLDAARNGEEGHALIEYGALPGEDTDSEEVWLARHPGLAAGLTDLDALRQARATLGHAGFAREFMCAWSRTAVSVIRIEDWRACAEPDPMPSGRAHFGADVSADRTSAAIAACGPGRITELVEAEFPIERAAGRVLDVLARHRGTVAVPKDGPAGSLFDELRRLLDLPEQRRRGLTGAMLRTMAAQDHANAFADFVDDVRNRKARIRFHPTLDAALGIAGTRRLGDEGYTWGRRSSAGNIAPLVAVTLAGWAHAHAPAPASRPVALAG